MSALRWRLLLALAAGIVTWLLLAPAPAVPAAGGGPHYDKLAHVLLFAALGLLARRAFRDRPRATLLLALVAYAALIEWVQPLAGRSREALDLLAGGLGAACGIFLPLGRSR